MGSPTLEEAEAWRSRGERVALATLVASRRSAPRPLGSTLAVSERGELAGSVSGGCVEADVALAAKEVLASGKPELLVYGIADETAWEVGLPCGGEIEVLLEPFDGRASMAEGERAAALTWLDEPKLGRREVVREGERVEVDGLIRSGRNRTLELEGARVFVEVLGPPPRLLVFGAVDTAESLCAAAKLLGWRAIVVDARARFATAERLPSADEIVVAWPEEALERIEPGADTAVVVLTHDERFDIPALAGALASDAFYVAALGSRRNQERRRELLLEAGVGEKALGRVHGPAGLDIGADSQAEVALAILAEAVAVRAGREGGPLSGAAGPIHANG